MARCCNIKVYILAFCVLGALGKQKRDKLLDDDSDKSSADSKASDESPGRSECEGRKNEFQPCNNNAGICRYSPDKDGVPGHMSCVPVDCSDPPSMAATTLDSGSTLLGTVRTYTCLNDYITQAGSNTISTTCEEGGQWSTTTLACLRDCGTPPAVSHASVISGDTYDGAVRQYTCDSPYQVKAGGVVTTSTTVNATCDSDGSWGVGFECVLYCASSGPLVSGSDGIADDKITASSEYPDYYAHFGRLDDARAWSPLSRDNNSYIQFDFTTQRIITSITTQGNRILVVREWVSSYYVLYSSTCAGDSFEIVKDASGSPETFTGNSDGDGHMTNTFAEPILARCVRVNAQTWHNWITLSAELYGC